MPFVAGLLFRDFARSETMTTSCACFAGISRAVTRCMQFLGACFGRGQRGHRFEQLDSCSTKFEFEAQSDNESSGCVDGERTITESCLSSEETGVPFTNTSYARESLLEEDGSCQESENGQELAGASTNCCVRSKIELMEESTKAAEDLLLAAGSLPLSVHEVAPILQGLVTIFQQAQKSHGLPEELTSAVLEYLVLVDQYFDDMQVCMGEVNQLQATARDLIAAVKETMQGEIYSDL